MRKSFFSYALFLCATWVAYLYIGDYIDKHITADPINSQQLMLLKTLEPKNLLASWTLSWWVVWNDLVSEQEKTNFLKSFIEEMKKDNVPLLITSWVNSTLYLWDQSSWVVQVSTSVWVDMYFYILEETDYRVPVALWWEGYNQSDFYEIMKEKWVAANSWCTLDQDGFEITTEEYQKKLDDYWKRYEDSQKLWEIFVDDWSVDPLRCGNKIVFCTAQWCGWVFNGKSWWWGHWFIMRQESLVIH